jgi:RsiW-degrading membrane proteinase PrsW (M82 family)
MRTAAYCLKCSISNPGVSDLVPDRNSDLRKHDEKRLRGAWVLAIVVLGSVLGIPARFLSETSAGIMATWISAPVIEELFKPFGVYLIIAFWPSTIRNQTSIAALAGLAGLAFGLFESTLYVYVYEPSGVGENYALFRFTVPVGLHIVASTVFGLGVNREAFQSLGQGNLPARRSWFFILAAMCLHASYNIAVTFLPYL